MRRRLFLEWLIVTMVSCAAVWICASWNLTDRADNLVYDTALTMRAHAPSDVVIVAIDDASLAAIGRWPWPRRVHTALLRRLADVHPKAVGYDVLFPEPGPDDVELAKAMRRVGSVVLPAAFLVPGMNGASYDAELPTPPLAQAARAIGHATIIPDRDGIVRRVDLIAGSRRSNWPHVSEQIHRVATGKPSAMAPGNAATTLPDDRFGMTAPMLIPFAGAAGTHREISFASVMNGEVPPELLRNRVILVGSTAAGSGDQYPVPGGTMPGVEILATIVDALEAGHGISAVGPVARMAFSMVPLAILLVSFLLLTPRANLVLGVALVASMLALSVALLIWADLWIPPVAGLAGLMIVYPLWGWRRLEAASAYLMREVRQLQGETDLTPARAAPAPRARLFGEVTAEQSLLLHFAIERVRDLRRFFADSLQNLPDPTLILDTQGDVVVANSAAERLFGKATIANGTAASAESLLDSVFPDTAGGRTHSEADEVELATADGRFFVLRSAPLVDATGTHAGSILRLNEVSAIRLAERQREDALRLLSHDMRSPQASILALAERMDPSDALRPRIMAAAQRTLALADSFVQLARARSVEPARDLLDFSALLTEAIDEHWAVATQRGIRLTASGDDIEHLIVGDRSLLSRILGNLIDNAIKYSDGDSAITCTIGRQEAIDGAAPAMIRCDIADQGHGIPADQIAAIFQPFHRVSMPDRPDVGGTGLGLALVETVVNRHSGTIECRSTLGVGTVFTIRLPLADAA